MIRHNKTVKKNWDKSTMKLLLQLGYMGAYLAYRLSMDKLEAEMLRVYLKTGDSNE